MIALKALALVAFLLLPGWLAVSLLEGKSGVRGMRDGEGSCDEEGEPSSAHLLDGKERLFLAAALGTGIVSLCALILALASAYRLWSLLLLVALLCVPMAVLGRQSLSWPLRLGRKDYLICLALVAVALVLVSPPGKIVFGWSDVGVYANIAALIERTGGQSFDDPLVVKVDPERRELLYVPNDGPNSHFEAYQNKAFYITDMESGTITPQFYYLWPSLMAVFASFLGLANMFWAVTAAGVMALWGFFLLAKRMLGSRWGLLATVYMAITPIFLYFAKYTTSEMMNLFLFLGASICFSAYLKKRCAEKGGDAGRLAVGAAVFLILGFLCRIDFILALVPIIFFFAVKSLAGRFSRDDFLFIILTIFGALLSLLIGSIFSAPYFYDVLGVFESRIGWSRVFSGILFLVALALVLAYARRLGRNHTGMFAKKHFNLRIAFVSLLWVVMMGLFTFLYFVRPHGAGTQGVYGGLNAIMGPLYKEETLVRWGWYFSFLGVLAIYLGYALWLTVRRDFPSILMGVIGLAFTLIYSWDLHNTPLHILSMRRLVPVILPLATIMVIFVLKRAVEAGARSARGRWWGRVALAVSGVAFLYLFFYAANVSVPVMGLAEGGNQMELCERIAESVESNAVVLMDYHMGDLYGAPLRCFFGVENAWLTENEVLRTDLHDLLMDLGFPETPVYLLWRESMSGDSFEIQEGLALEEAGEYRWREEALQSSFTHRPEGRTRFIEKIELLRLRDSDIGKEAKGIIGNE
ncbi:MAG: hypothetical protein HPY75_00385 [Actinobacteria bacterium]|nr:hypothetical protein [Actinomycetota bacterium]